MSAAAAQTPRVPGRAGDLWGGFAAMLVALPSSIAYGVAIYSVLGAEFVGHGVMAGILGAIAMGLFAPALGGAPRLISAPCAPAAAVLAALAAGLLAGSHSPGGAFTPEKIVVLLMLVALMAGALQLLYGVAGGGKLIKFIPYPVVAGYLSGVGVLIFLSQVPKFFGLSKGVNVWAGLADPAHWKWPGIIVGAVTILGMVAAPKITKAVPAAIIGLAGGLLAYFGLGLVHPELLHLEHNKLIIGPIGGSLGSLWSAFLEHWKAIGALHLDDFKHLLSPALTLSVLLSIDTLKTCVIVDAMTRSRHNSNRELIGQGVGNLASAVIGGMPGAGTMGATLVNVNSGGQTRLSGVLEGVFVLAAFLLFGNFIAWVPIAALAGILMVVAYRMFDWESFQLLKSRNTILDFLVILAVIITAVEFSLIAASGVGLALAILLFIREQIRGSVIRRKVYGSQISSKKNRLDLEKEILAVEGRHTVICELQGSLFFGTTDQLFTELEKDLKHCRFVILDMHRVQSVDFTAAHMLEQLQAMLKEHGGMMIFSSLPASLPTGQDLQAYFHQVGVMDATENVKLFDAADEALEWAEDRILEAAQATQTEGSERALELPEIDLLREFESDQTLSVLKTCVQERSVPVGQMIFKHGDTGDELFLIRRGVVRIQLPLEDGKHYNLAYFGRGNFFGEMAFLDRGTRSADAVAVTDTDLFVLSRAGFDATSRPHPLLGVKLFARLARALSVRLRHTDAELRALHES
ncbi:MAG: SLC26A/SulP transporter family protein [Verrucomicrobia bacterium]|nr:SLC26A/SulP transporter family protein [Verrucomicrobiota bacterium]